MTRPRPQRAGDITESGRRVVGWAVRQKLPCGGFGWLFNVYQDHPQIVRDVQRRSLFATRAEAMGWLRSEGWRNRALIRIVRARPATEGNGCAWCGLAETAYDGALARATAAESARDDALKRADTAETTVWEVAAEECQALEAYFSVEDRRSEKNMARAEAYETMAEKFRCRAIRARGKAGE